MTGDQALSERVYRVLLVDDEELLCRAITRIMSPDRRFVFSAVTRARRAWRVFADDGPFDILLVDLNLTDGRGVDLAAALQRVQPDLKVVFMSGDIPADFAGRGLSIDKPFERDELIQTLEKALGLR